MSRLISQQRAAKKTEISRFFSRASETVRLPGGRGRRDRQAKEVAQTAEASAEKIVELADRKGRRSTAELHEDTAYCTLIERDRVPE